MRTDPNNPATVVNSLREIMVVDKLPIGFLLGAGCASSIAAANQDGAPFIPDAAGLTKAVLDQSPSNLRKPFERLQAMLVDDGYEKPTIEHMLTRVRAMQTVVGKDEVRGFSHTDLQRLEQSICQIISKVVKKPLPESMTPYHSLARWIGRRTKRTAIFTTNYDLLIEQALEALQVPFFDGFIGSYRPFFDQQAIDQNDFPPHWTLICKLHGSINWRLVGNSNNIVRSLDSEVGDEQLIIHPSHLKYAESRRMPYFVMLDRLRAFILNDKKPAVLFTVGYSFSDEHINDIIADSLRANPSAISYALQYDRLSAYPPVANLAQRCSNLHVLAPDEAVNNGRHFHWETYSSEQVEELGGAFRPQCPNEDSSTIKGEVLENHEVAVEFCLGDFNAFGHFLASLSPAKTLPIGEAEATS